jgi:hypothetical protein
MPPAEAAGERCDPEAPRKSDGADDPKRLPEGEPKRRRRRDNAGFAVEGPLQADAGVGEREERHDAVRHPRMKGVNQALRRRNGFAAGLVDVFERVPEPCLRPRTEPFELPLDPANEAIGA